MLFCRPELAKRVTYHSEEYVNSEMRYRWSVFLLCLEEDGISGIFPIQLKKCNTENSVGPLLSLLWRGPAQEDGMDGPSSPDKGGCEITCCGGGAKMQNRISRSGKGLHFSYEQCPKQLTEDERSKLEQA